LQIIPAGSIVAIWIIQQISFERILLIMKNVRAGRGLP
jgi:hypothetical protein